MEKIFIGTVTFGLFLGLLNTWASLLGFDPMWIAIGLLTLFTFAAGRKLISIVS